MKKPLNNVVKFKQMWRGRQPGQIDKNLAYGVAAMLVQRGIAEFYEPKKSRKKQPEPA